MFQTIDSFLKAWEYEARQTQKVLDTLTDDSLNQAITSENWTLGRIGWHIVTAIHIIASPTGLEFEGQGKDWPVPESAQFIARKYQQASESFVNAIKTQWTNEHLQNTTHFFGQNMSNGVIMQFFINHQIHHRGQMTVLMRQAGLPVPGLYGPSKEEWAKYGMEAPQL
ncbi:DinB family protein [Peribacillus alkalitolerans]|uniref:DinB family protein n=1 Tax=Peribacillus alkalitolerans TaxID=1550385 RepID=UPI0013D629C2|nr:DinB family protein [Peribacillus alkalitolerans]